MPDIVANLLHLSSAAADVDELLEPSLDLVLTATAAEAAAVARATAPKWTIQAARNVAAGAVPLQQAARRALDGLGVVHVEAEDQHARVAGHLLVGGLADGLDVGEGARRGLGRGHGGEGHGQGSR